MPLTRPNLRRFLWPLAVLVAGLLLSAFAAFQSWRWQRQSLSEQLAHESTQLANRMSP